MNFELGYSELFNITSTKQRHQPVYNAGKVSISQT